MNCYGSLYTNLSYRIIFLTGGRPDEDAEFDVEMEGGAENEKRDPILNSC